MQFFKTPDELEVELGEQLRAERLRQNLTMLDVALRAGISEQTIRSLENGSGGRLNSFIRLMKALGKEEWLGTFRPAVHISPIYRFATAFLRLYCLRSRSRGHISSAKTELAVSLPTSDRAKSINSVIHVRRYLDCSESCV